MIDLSNLAKESSLAGIGELINKGTAPSVLMIMAGTKPAAGGAGTQVLAEFLLPANIIGSITAGAMVFSAVDQTQVQISGTVSWGRIVNGDGEWVVDLDVGEEGSNASIIMADLVIYQGALLSLVSARLQY